MYIVTGLQFIFILLILNHGWRLVDRLNNNAVAVDKTANAAPKEGWWTLTKKTTTDKKAP